MHIVKTRIVRPSEVIRQPFPHKVTLEKKEYIEALSLFTISDARSSRN